MQTKATSNKAKRGRPKGSLNGFAQKDKKWQPKTWKPLYEAIVCMHLQGYTNKFIADKIQKTEQTVSNVLTCDMARGVIRAMELKIREKTSDNASKLINDSYDLIARRIHDVLNNNDLAKTAPLAMGNFAIKAGQSIGALKHGNDDKVPGVINNNMQVNMLFGNKEDLAQVVRGMSAAQKARELHSGVTGEPIGVIKNDFALAEPVPIESRP